MERVAKETVRSAISSEYSRQPLRVKNIRASLASMNVRKTRGPDFVNMLSTADLTLIEIFGMRLIRLPPAPAAGAAAEKSAANAGAKRAGRKKQRTDDSNDVDASQAADPSQRLQHELEDELLVASNTAGQVIPNTPGNLPPRHYPNVSATDMFILRSTLPQEYRDIVHQYLPAQDRAYMAVVAIIVSLIALRSDHLGKPDLDAFLSELDLPYIGKMSPYLSWDEVMKKLQTDMYVERETKSINEASGNKREFVTYSLGKRAKREFTIDTILQMCEHLLPTAYDEDLKDTILNQLKRTDMIYEDKLTKTW